MGEHNWEVSDLSQPLERSAEDIIPAVNHADGSHGNSSPRLVEGGCQEQSAEVVSSGLSVVEIKPVPVSRGETGALESMTRAF